jgi:hypothetical protein
MPAAESLYRSTFLNDDILFVVYILNYSMASVVWHYLAKSYVTSLNHRYGLQYPTNEMN